MIQLLQYLYSKLDYSLKKLLKASLAENKGCLGTHMRILNALLYKYHFLYRVNASTK